MAIELMASEEYVNAVVAGVQTFQKYLVQTLPDLATADMKGLYLVPTGETSEEGDQCDAYTVVEESGVRRWKKIGGGAVDPASLAPLASPAFTGTPTAPTPQISAPPDQIANISYVNKVADEVSPLVARSFTVPKNGAPDGSGGASTIFFYPRYLGMSNGDRMKSFIVRRRIAGGPQTAVPVYVELQNSSGVTLATSKTQTLPGDLGVYVLFEFPESVAISNKDAQHRLVFYDTNDTSNPYTANLNFYQYPENNPDCYFGTYSQAFVPDLTVQYYAWASNLITSSTLAGQPMPAVPSQNQLTEIVKQIFTALGGTIE